MPSHNVTASAGMAACQWQQLHVDSWAAWRSGGDLPLIVLPGHVSHDDDMRVDACGNGGGVLARVTASPLPQ
eukprot:362798-Chlamydomonas_euryale.AAC.1